MRIKLVDCIEKIHFEFCRSRFMHGACSDKSVLFLRLSLPAVVWRLGERAWWIMYLWSRKGIRLSSNGRNVNKHLYNGASYYFTGICQLLRYFVFVHIIVSLVQWLNK